MLLRPLLTHMLRRKQKAGEEKEEEAKEGKECHREAGRWLSESMKGMGLLKAIWAVTDGKSGGQNS